jgi:multiple sugar transport system permease protein
MPESVRVPPTILPSEWNWDAFQQVFSAVPFTEMLTNSLMNTVGRTLGQLVFCSLAAYAFARLQFRGKNVLFAVFLSVLMVPSQLLVLPQHEIIQRLGLLNSIPALFLPGMFSAFGTFLLRQFFMALPRELEEAARIDGAGPFRIFWSIMLPLVRPALAALAVITAMWSWNDLLWPLVVNTPRRPRACRAAPSGQPRHDTRPGAPRHRRPPHGSPETRESSDRHEAPTDRKAAVSTCRNSQWG